MRQVLMTSPYPGMLVGDLLLLELPMITSEDERDAIAWEFTGFPAFWALREQRIFAVASNGIAKILPPEWHANQTFRRQLKEFKGEIV